MGLGPTTVILGTNVALTSDLGLLVHIALITWIFFNDDIQHLMVTHTFMMAFKYKPEALCNYMLIKLQNTHMK